MAHGSRHRRLAALAAGKRYNVNAPLLHRAVTLMAEEDLGDEILALIALRDTDAG